jgi:hypothetical protein
VRATDKKPESGIRKRSRKYIGESIKGKDEQTVLGLVAGNLGEEMPLGEIF